jgi:hypothetical protein
MVIERIASVNQSYLNEPAIPKIGGEMKEGDSDHDDTVPKSDLELKNDVRKQVLSGLDLNGDGVVSQAEAISNAGKYSQAAPPSQASGKSKDTDLEQVLNGPGSDGNSVDVLA